ncbi:MAG TPA: magnesium transporter CorA family protein [bacterium]
MLRSFLRDGRGGVEFGVSPERMRAALADPETLLWVDMESPDDADIELLLEVFELHPLTVEDCIMPTARPKLEDFDRYLFAVLQSMKRDETSALQPVELNACLGQNFLLTVRTETIKSVEEDWARVERHSPIFTRGTDFLFYAIADSFLDSYLPLLEQLDARVDVLEASLLSDSTEDTLRELFRVYGELMLLRRTLAPHREILTRINRLGDLPFIRPANAAYFRDIYDHLLRMSDLVDAGREMTMALLDAQATIASNRENRIMKRMTAGATLALPLIIVTGIYGMNFSEHAWLPVPLFHALSLIMIGSLPVMLVLFRRNRWL